MARLVADDQLFLFRIRRPPLLHGAEDDPGLAEVRGHGPARLDVEPAARIDLLVKLVAPQVAPRYPDRQTAILAGCELAFLALAARRPAGRAPCRSGKPFLAAF